MEDPDGIRRRRRLVEAVVGLAFLRAAEEEEKEKEEEEEEEEEERRVVYADCGRCRRTWRTPEIPLIFLQIDVFLNLRSYRSMMADQ